MSVVVERVAEAIAKAQGAFSLIDRDDEPIDCRAEQLRVARAAIEALRACHDKILEAIYKEMGSPSDWCMGEEDWSAVIDRILK